MKVFDGFTADMASDFTGLTPGEIEWLRSQGIVLPKRAKAGYYIYTFTELLMMRLVKLLKLNKIKVKNIKKSKDYLKNIEPSKRLFNLKLYIHSSSGDILYLGEEPQNNVMVNMTKFGQLMAQNLLDILPVGRDLEELRLEVVGLDDSLAERIQSPKLIPMEQVFKKYGIR